MVSTVKKGLINSDEIVIGKFVRTCLVKKNIWAM